MTRAALRRVLREALRGEAIDLTLVDVRLARGQGVLPSLRAAAGHVDVADVARARMLLVDLARAVAVLDEASIPSVVLKGGALLASGRVRPGARHCDDVDLFVDPASAGRALALLEGRGFVVVEGVLADGTPHRDHPTHQLPLMRAPGGTLIELHVGTHVPDEAFDDVVADAPFVDVEGVGVRVPSPPRLLRQLCAHVVSHHAGEARLWPRHLFDLAALADVHAPLVDDDPAVRRSRGVLRGFVDPVAASASERMWAAALVVPEPAMARVARAGRLVARTARAARQGELRASVWPDAAHLRFSGDLPPSPGQPQVLEITRARLRRWRRLLGR